MKNFHDLSVWEKSHRLTLRIYRETRGFPREEIYGLTSQMRRAAASIPANIAEGCGRGGNIEMARYLRIALGSASELEYHLLLARDLELLSTTTHAELDALTIEIKRMLTGLAKTRTADGKITDR